MDWEIVCGLGHDSKWTLRPFKGRGRAVLSGKARSSSLEDIIDAVRMEIVYVGDDLLDFCLRGMDVRGALGGGKSVAALDAVPMDIIGWADAVAMIRGGITAENRQHATR